MPEYRVSPDGDAIAIRRDTDPDAFNAWAVMHKTHGGHYAPAAEVEDWTPLTPSPDSSQETEQ